MTAAPISARPVSALVAAWDALQLRPAARLVGGESQEPRAILERVFARVSARRNAAVPVAKAAVPVKQANRADDDALLAVFFDEDRPAVARYDAALAISARIEGLPEPVSIATMEGLAARLGEVRAAISTTTDPRERGRLSAEASSLSRGKVPVPERGLSAAAGAALWDAMSSRLSAATDPRERCHLGRQLRALRAAL
jgi:hypothetical protein